MRKKTEVIVFAPRSRIKMLNRTSLPFHHLQCPKCEQSSHFFSFTKQCNAVSMTFFSLIRKIKPILHFNFLTDAACQKSVHSLIASWLDYEHLLLYNIQCTLLIASTLNNKLKTKILSPSYLIYISFLLWVECTINMCIQGAP